MSNLAALMAKVEKHEDDAGNVTYVIAPADLYPAMLALLASDAQPELPDPPLTPEEVATLKANPRASITSGNEEDRKQYASQLAAMRQSPEAITGASAPLSEVLQGKSYWRAERAAVLELARRWFTAELHVKHRAAHPGVVMHLHIKVPRVACSDCEGAGTLTTRAGNEVDCPACQSRGTIKVICNWRQ